MSTNSNCEFDEVKPGEWYYLLENYSAPKHADDWREYSRAFGPFKTEDAASDHLSKHHANPGSATINSASDGYVPDDVVLGLIKSARK